MGVSAGESARDMSARRAMHSAATATSTALATVWPQVKGA
jgi:hypothetical protein